MVWSIAHALAAKTVDRVIVSTDSPHYARISREAGAEVPFLRPIELAADDSTDLEVFQHALRWLNDHEGQLPEICVHLRPTHPVRKPGLIDRAVRLLRERPALDSVRTVAPVVHPPFKMWFRDPDGLLSPLKEVPGIAEPWNTPRQELPRTYLQTANVDAVRTSVILERGSMTGSRIYGLLEETSFDIDNEQELKRADVELWKQARRQSAAEGALEAEQRTFCFDIDGVIASITPDNDYRLAHPRREMIALVNALHDAGHEIVLCTARGSKTGIDWQDFTKEQMANWGVKYDNLMLGKPAADYYIDDRMLAMENVRDFVDNEDPPEE